MRIALEGTRLLPEASGEVEVDTAGGCLQMEVVVRNLPLPSLLGREFLTWVLWAVHCDGRVENLGEFILVRGTGRLSAVIPAQPLALLVTAEPFFAVEHPTDTIVLENAFRTGDPGQTGTEEARFELLERGQYDAHAGSLRTSTGNVPLDLLQARNALRIAKAAGAAFYARSLLEHAQDCLGQAESGRGSRAGRASMAREAVRSAANAWSAAVQQQQWDPAAPN
jgi:hypothetical protein